MKVINPHLYIQEVNFTDYKNQYLAFIKCCKTLKNKYDIFRNEIFEILDSSEFEETSEKEREWIQLKINNKENLFYEFYSIIQNIEYHSFNEKVIKATESYIRWTRTIRFYDIYVTQLNEKFKMDLCEYLILKNEEKEKTEILTKFQSIF